MGNNYTDVMSNNYIDGRVIAITGAANGFGKLTAIEIVKMGGKVVISDVLQDKLMETVKEIEDLGYADSVAYIAGNAACYEDVETQVKIAVEKFGKLDAFVANAGTMPLAGWSQHAKARSAWERCIDVNLKGTMYAISATYDQFIEQGFGHFVTISSVYGNFPVAGSNVYGATKIGVRYMVNALRVESQGKIKVSIVSPTGVPGTALTSTVADMATGAVGATGQNYQSNWEKRNKMGTPAEDPDWKNQDSVKYLSLKPEEMVWGIMFVLNQPYGVDVSDISVRSTGEGYIL